MNRKVLLVEPNYKNKYPPMGLMKMATYFRESGDDVRFFKGDLRDLVAENDVDALLENLAQLDPSVKWRKKKQLLITYFRKGKNDLLDEDAELTENIIAYEMVRSARKAFRNQDYFEEPIYDFVGVTTLFTFYFDITVETINFAKRLCKNDGQVMVGGILASLLPDKLYEATGIHPFVGQLDKPGDIDPGDTRIIDYQPLDYSILEEIDYKYPANDAYFAYMTRGCINHCAFCAVPSLEPRYCNYIGIKHQIEIATKRFGMQRDLLLLDNNVLASDCYEQIINEIEECGFGKGAAVMPVNEYEVALYNLQDNYNNRAYIKKTISLYKQLMPKLPEDKRGEFYTLLDEHDLLEVDTAERDEIIAIDDIVRPMYNKYIYSKKRSKRRIVDFNQGIDSRLVNEKNMEIISHICICPLRIAFDHWELRDIYVRSVKTAVNNGITELSNYLLYNFKDRPEELYYRLKINAELCEELNATIYSFPMKYHPIFDDDYFMNRDYIGEHWNRKFIRAVQAVLNSTKGCIGRGLDFFYEAFGKDEDRFWTILWMPESFIVYRMKFKDTLAKEWEEKFKALSEDKLAIAKSIISTDKFTDINLEDYDEQVADVLKYYMINRDEAARM